MNRACLFLALACLTASLAAEAGRWSGPLDLLAEFAPFWLVGALVATAAALVLKTGRREILVVGLAGVAASAALLAPEFLRSAPRGPSGEGFRLRLIQINYGGRGVKDPDQVARWLADQRPDVIFVDDVDPAIRDAIMRRGFHWRKGTAWTGIAARAALLPAPFPFSVADWREMPDLARARLSTPLGPADLIAVHLVRPLPGTQAAAKSAADRLEELSSRYDRRRLIMAGDLNLTPWSFALRQMDADLGLTRRDRADFTWPARLFGVNWSIAFMPLDHLYAGPGWRTISVRVGPPIGATHRALVVDLAETP